MHSSRARHVCLLLLAGVIPLSAQTDSGIVNPDHAAPPINQPAADKRAFGVLPNYRTAEGSVPFRQIDTTAKFRIAFKDSFDYPVLLTTAFFTGVSQLQGSDNSIYGQGVEGFAHRYGIEYADQVVGNFFPEAIIPTLFHMDPRYFRKGEGSVGNRALYAISRIIVCKTDAGKTTLCAPEIVGNLSAATATRAYHPHERTVGDAAEQFGTYMETDLVGDLVKEFWPDIKRKLFHKHSAPGSVTGE